MLQVQVYINLKQKRFEEHAFFKLLNQFTSIKQAEPVIYGMTFWSMAFQDVLRINESRITRPDYKKIASHHRMEDKGHDLWFLQDLSYINALSSDSKELSINWLFDSANEKIRDQVYALMSEVFMSKDERLNIVLLLALESSGHVFFRAFSALVDNLGLTDKLKYFSRYHLDAELAHDMFSDGVELEISSIEFNSLGLEQSKQLVDRIYMAFTSMFNHFLSLCLENEKRMPWANNPVGDMLLDKEVSSEMEISSH